MLRFNILVAVTMVVGLAGCAPGPPRLDGASRLPARTSKGPIEMDEQQIENHIRRTPPTCVKGFRLTVGDLPEPWDDSFKTVYHLACQCHNESGVIFGHRLQDYNPDYDGPDLITPLGFKCSKCETVTEIIDTHIHGFHAEAAKIEGGIGSSIYRGDGARTAYECPKCSGTTFKKVTVGFVYWHFDLVLDQPDRPAQEFFNVFLIYVSCQDCGHVSQPTDLGKL